MILVDTSAWIEYLRDTRTHVAGAVSRLITADLATTDPVAMELLAGARDDDHLESLRGLLARCTHVGVEPADWDDAARISRTARRAGVTVRRMADCLIAAVAMRADAEVLHADGDFDRIARVAPLAIHRDARGD